MPDAVFSLASITAMSAWVGLAVAALLTPGTARRGLLWLCGRGVPLALALAYVAALWRYWGTAPGGGFSSLAAVGVLFSVPGKVLGAWLHFLAFDLLVGRWLVDHALTSGQSRMPLIVALPATFLYGPLGVLLYVAAQGVCGRLRAAPAQPLVQGQPLPGGCTGSQRRSTAAKVSSSKGLDR